MSASEHLLSRIRAHIPAGYWRVLSVYRVAHGGATSAAVRRPVCSLPMVVTGSLALGMDGGGHRHAGPPHAPATRGLVLPRSRLAVGSTRDAHLVRRAAARRADHRAGGWALALLPRTKVRSPARPRARHLAPCPAPRSPRPRAPLSALAGRSRYSPCPPAPLAGARRPRPQAPRMRGGPGVHARARVKPAGASARRLCSGYVYSYVNSLTHTQTHKKARPARRKMPWSQRISKCRIISESIASRKLADFFPHVGCLFCNLYGLLLILNGVRLRWQSS